MDFLLRRISASLIDHLIFGCAAFLIALPGLLLEFFVSGFGLRFHYGNIYLNSIALAVYLGKDLIMPQSPGKRAANLALISNREGHPLKAHQLLLRNLTFVIWPIELICEFMSPDRRIGDMLGGTIVTSSVSSIPSISLSARISCFLLAILISFAVQAAFRMIIYQLNPLFL